MWQWLFAHPTGWFITVMALWCALWLFSASLSALSKEADEAVDKDDREDTD